MATLNLTNQQAAVNTIQPYLNALKTRLDQRAEIWAKIPFEKKKAWITSEKDPILDLASDMIRYFVNNFPDLVEHHQGRDNG